MDSPNSEASKRSSSRWHEGLPLESNHGSEVGSQHDEPTESWSSRLRWKIWGMVNFYRAHLLYFITLDIIGTFIIWLSSPTDSRISFIDALFSVTSALTCTGLVPVYMNKFSVFNQCILMLMILLGGQVFTSLLPVLIRRYYFLRTIKKVERNLKDKVMAVDNDVENGGNGHGALSSADRLGTIKESASHSHLDLAIPSSSNDPSSPPSGASPLVVATADKDEIRMAAAAISEASRKAVGKENPAFPTSLTWSGETAKAQGQRFKMALKLFEERRQSSTEGSNHILQPTNKEDPLVGSSGSENAHGIFQSVDLRSMEYKALRTLSFLVPAYYLSIQLVAFLLIRMTFWIYSTQRSTLRLNNVNPTFYSAFQAVSAFGNAGYSLLDLSMTEFQEAVLLLFIVGTLILLGNTMYPPTMRGIVYLMSIFLGENLRSDLGLTYLLDHPRKCFTHLFPFHQTLWLTITVIAFNSIELFFFCVLDWNAQVLQELAGRYKFLDGLFQSINTRNSGFAVVSIGGLSPPMLFLYVAMMYVAVYPVFLSRQSSKPDKEIVLRRVGSQLSDSSYHDQQVGVFDSGDAEFNDRSIASQARKLIGRDSALLFLCAFLVTIIHADDLRHDPNFTIFSILFEVVSAYGNVGLSLGYTCVPPEGGTCVSPPYSFSGLWSVGAKLVICFVMMMGRHRGLPENIDDAVRLPEEEKFQRGTYVKEASLRFPDELVDPVEKVMLLRAEKRENKDLFRAITDKVGGSQSSSPQVQRSLPRGVSIM